MQVVMTYNHPDQETDAPKLFIGKSVFSVAADYYDDHYNDLSDITLVVDDDGHAKMYLDEEGQDTLIHCFWQVG